MHIIRPIQMDDFETLKEFALTATSGIVTLPRSSQRLKQKISDSLESFSSQTQAPGKYLFAIENLETQRMEGCSAILASAGTPNEEYYYKLDFIVPSHRPIEKIPRKQKILIPHVAPVEDTSEICTLFLSPQYQKAGFGRLLSLSRFLFITCQRERFLEKIIAEIRGVIDQNGMSPFWEAIGRHFCDIHFEEFMALFETKILQATDIISSYPIYCSLLPPSAQDVIGKPHLQALPALKMLEKEGFTLVDGVDISDGGPKLKATIEDVRSIKNAIQGIITFISPPSQTPETLRPHIASNTKINFRACYAEVHSDRNDGLIIDANEAEALQVTVGETICYTNR